LSALKLATPCSTARLIKTTAMKKALPLLLALAATCLLTTARAEDLKGDVQAGGKKNAMCIGCHGILGYQSSFPQVYKVPMIAGQNQKYLVSALTEYREGNRKHPTMRAVAGSLSDQDIADLAAYYAALGHDTAAPAVPAQVDLPVALTAKMAACSACHGSNFNNTTDPANPRLAGQYADYLRAALHAYQVDGNPQVGRGNATMVGMAKTLSGDDIQQIAAFLSGLPGEVKTVPQSKFR
jgi:cytochrome c553